VDLGRSTGGLWTVAISWQLNRLIQRRNSTALSPLPTARCPARALPFLELNEFSVGGPPKRYQVPACTCHEDRAGVPIGTTAASYADRHCRCVTDRRIDAQGRAARWSTWQCDRCGMRQAGLCQSRLHGLPGRLPRPTHMTPHTGACRTSPCQRSRWTTETACAAANAPAACRPSIRIRSMPMAQSDNVIPNNSGKGSTRAGHRAVGSGDNAVELRL